LALALCSAFWFTSYSNSQPLSTGTETYTGNLTNFTSGATPTTSTWQNAGTIGAPLSCWSPGDSGYCGPLPMVSAWGEGSNIINFSYQLTDLYQVVNIGAALANAGTGIKVTGFNFSFTAKNGNGWDGGQQDYLSAYVKFYSNSQGQGQGQNNLAESYFYDLNYQFGWTQFNYNETFKNSYDLSKLSTAQYGFVGGDSNGWAGPYGPEVSNTSFSLKYSVDPCASNVFHSPSCPGYLDAIAKLSAPSTEPTVSAMIDPVAPALASGPVVSASTPTSSTSQTKPGEAVIAGAPAKNSTGPSMSLIMNILSRESARVGSVEKSVVQTAVSDAQEAAQQAQSQGGTVVDNTNSSGIASSLARSTPSSTTTVTTSSDITNLPTAPTSGSFYQSNDNQQVTSSSVSVNYALTSPVFANTYNTNTITNAEVELPKSDELKMGTRSALTDYLNERAIVSSTGPGTTRDSSVQRNIQPNEVAGGVDIAAIATVPSGYATYSQMTLQDSAFYQVEAIYKNQRTIDNARVLRGLQRGSDRLHQDMVDQQYKLGK
jgi:hypothetical protein